MSHRLPSTARSWALILFALALTAPRLSAQEEPTRPQSATIGGLAPSWENLEGVDGRRHSRRDLDKADVLVVIFFENHCPDCQLYHDRIVELSTTFASRPVAFLLVSVSQAPADNLVEMKKLAVEKHLKIPYVKDPSQSLGRAFGATNTPEVFVLNRERRLAYRGAIDDHFRLAKVKNRYAVDAINALLAGREPAPVETEARGCSIEYTVNPSNQTVSLH